MKRLQQSFKAQHQEFLSDEPPKKASHTITAGHDETNADQQTTATGSGGTSSSSTANTSNDALAAKQAASFAVSSLDEDDEPELGVLADDATFPVCLGVNRSFPRLRANRRVTCTLCQEDEVRLCVYAHFVTGYSRHFSC